MSLMSKYLALEIAHEAAPLLLYPNPGILTTAAEFFATLAESINTGMDTNDSGHFLFRGHRKVISCPK